MNRLMASAALVWAGAAVLLAQSGGSKPAARPGRPVRTAPAAAAAQQPGPAAEAAKHRAWLNKNCVGCHNSRTAQPPDSPVNLEKASLDDLLPQAETWERVLRKLGARAMPP